MDGFKDDPFKGQDPFGGSDPAALTADPFQNEDPFKDSEQAFVIVVVVAVYVLILEWKVEKFVNKR